MRTIQHNVEALGMSLGVATDYVYLQGYYLAIY